MRYLKHCIVFIITISCIGDYAYGQACTGNRYISPVFDSVTVERGVKFGRGPVYSGDTIDLFMDIYQPYDDTVSARPVAIFAFGGAFIKGSRTDWYVILACSEIAKSGYVVAAIDYRIYNDALEFGFEIGLGQHQRIFFRPMQDMRAAVQYMKADFAELGNLHRIDTSRILIGGASSGAMTSLMTAYCDKESEMAEMGVTGTNAALDDLGGFYSTSSVYYKNYSWKALATFNVSGSLVNADWIEPGDIPIILAHGDADNVVPYKNGGFIPPFFDMQGSYTIDSVARAKGVCSYLYTMEGKDHPSDTLAGDYASSINYLKSVVYRMMLRMHAVVNGRSFCCGLDLKVNPVDTVYYQQGGEPVCLAACAVNDSGSSQLQWAGIKCLASTSSARVLTVQPDTNLQYIACVAYEEQCEALSLNMVKQGTPVACDTPYECKATLVLPLNEDGATVRVYPQPVSGSFMLQAEFPQPLSGIVTLEIIDMTGRKIYAQDIYADERRLNKTIDVKGLATGSYLLKLNAPGFQQYRKLVITN